MILPLHRCSLCVWLCVCAGQARDLGETVEMFQDATVQPFLYPAAFDLWNLLLHWVFQHPVWLGLHATLVSGTALNHTWTHTKYPSSKSHRTVLSYAWKLRLLKFKQRPSLFPRSRSSVNQQQKVMKSSTVMCHHDSLCANASNTDTYTSE